jgi:hypothetical protein
VSTKVISEERHICDFCHKGEAYQYTACLKCGKDCCYSCRDKVGFMEFKLGVYTGGTNDGYYCAECNAKAAATGDDELYNAYVTIRSLRLECAAFNSTFDVRRRAAEANLLKIIARERPGE